MVEVPLTRGQVALIDDEDADRVLAHKWFAQWDDLGKRYYAYTSSRSKRGWRPLGMHRLILNAPPDMQVDHINRNGLDNRRSNLRLATRSQNHWNSGRQRNNKVGFKGVYWDKRRKKFCVQIKRYGAQRHVGAFDTAIEAACAYDAAAQLLFGEFARVNFPNETHHLDPQVAAYLTGSRRTRSELRGAAHGRAKLTDEQAKSIRKAFACGISGRQLAADHAVSRPTIYRILRGETYRESF